MSSPLPTFFKSIIFPGAVGYWKMDDNLANTNILDKLATNNLTAIHNTEDRTVIGIINRAQTLDGTTDCFYKANPLGLPSGSSDSSLFVWFKPRVIQPARRNGLCTYGALNYYMMEGLSINDTGLYYEGYGNDISDIVYSYTPGEWYLFGFTRTGKTVQFYVNGIPLSTPKTLGTTPNIGTDYIIIGDNRLGLSWFCDGNVDETYIFNYKLTDAQVLSLFNEKGI